MKGLAWVWPSRATRWRRPALVATSVLFHIGVLTYLGANGLGQAWTLRSPVPDTFIPLEMEPRPMLPGEVARVRPAPPRSDDSPLPGSALADPDRPFRDPLDEEDPPAAPVPRIGPAAPGAPPAPAEVGTSPWSVQPNTLGDRVGRGLRTSPVGCRSRDLLTAAERAICDDRFGQRAAAAAPIDDTAGSPFAAEGARRLAQYEALRRPLAGGSGNVGPQDGPGSNFGIGVAGAHLDPSFRPDSTQNIRTDRRDGPR